MSKLLAVDLDGTLFYPKQVTHRISKKNVAFLRKWIDAGNKVVLVSSRSNDFTNKLDKEIKRPVCNDCGNPIMGEYLWEFHGLYYCEDCLDNHKESIDIDYY